MRRIDHLKERSAERYGLSVSELDIKNIELFISEKYPKIFKSGIRKTIVVIPFCGQKVAVVFNVIRKKILTFLPKRYILPKRLRQLKKAMSK